MKPPVAPLAAIAATAASEASVEAVRERICQLHLEQLLQRERPEGRSSEGWQKILSTAQSAVEARAEHSVIARLIHLCVPVPQGLTLEGRFQVICRGRRTRLCCERGGRTLLLASD